MNTASIRKLRRNFILVAMFSFIVVMLFVGGLINITNNLKIRHDMNEMLDYIIDNEGELPEHDDHISADSDMSSDSSGLSDSAGSWSSAARETAAGFLENVPEYIYTTRFFAVLFDAQGDVEEVKLSHIHSFDDKSAVEAAQSIRSYRFSFGNFGRYYFFKKASLEDDRSIVVVLDGSILINLNTSIVRNTVLICAAGFLLTFLAVLALSGRMIRPEIENARRQKMFITNASHELKTPLAVIRANTELEELMNGETEWTQSTLRQVDRLNGLIQNLVMVARAQEKDDPAVLTDVDASRAILETAEPYASLAMQQEKVLSTEGILPGIHMIADESRIRQLAAILIDNAFKYCDEKGTVTVAFAKTRIGRQVRLTVSNSYANGKNVDYSRFFERFYREDTAHTQDIPDDTSGNTSDSPASGKDGYGIGLSIAESICTQYRGSIHASWKDGVISFTCLLGA